MSTDNMLRSIVLLMSLNVIPVAGLVIKAAFKARDTAWHLHKPVRAIYIYYYSINILLIQYFHLKKMSKEQTAVFIAEHQWDYKCKY